MLKPMQSGFVWRIMHRVLLLRTLCPVHMHRSFRHFLSPAHTSCCETMLSDCPVLAWLGLHTDPPGILTHVWPACVLGDGHMLTVVLMWVQRSRRTGRMH